MFVFVGIGLLSAAVAYVVSRTAWSAAVWGVMGALVSYTFCGLFVLAWGFIGIFVWIAVVGLLSAIAYMIFCDPPGLRRTDLAVGGYIAVFVIAIPFISTSACFHAKAYHRLIGDVEASTFSTDTTPVDITQMRVVDQDYAHRLGEKRLGAGGALGSKVSLGTMNIQQVNGKLYWVAPLNHSGFFKWLAHDSTPGYVMVSATNPEDARLVQEIDGQPITLRYNMGSFFGQQPRRHAYQSGHFNKGLTDFTFEIDDAGNPYWVITTYRKRVGFSGSDATGVLLLDAQTGQIEQFGLNEVPEWVDRVQPEAFVVNQLNYEGKYGDGWLNAVFAKNNVRQVTGQHARDGQGNATLVYGDDNQSYWYTGLTSAGSDDSTVGFVLVNTRTKKTRFYKQPGATEYAARESAEGAVQEKRYNASWPILYNVAGLPTYFMTLHDDGGLVKAVAFVSVENYQTTGVDHNISRALRKYRQALASRGNSIAVDALVTYQQARGPIARITPDVQGGTTNYYIVVEGYPQRLFVGTADTSFELPISRVGDVVTIEFDESGNSPLDIMKFDNANYTFQYTPAAEAADQAHDEFAAQQRSERAGQNADAAWENLSPEEKAALLKQAQ